MVFINTTGSKFVEAHDWTATNKNGEYYLRINSTLIPIEKSDFDALLSAVKSSSKYYQFSNPINL